MLAQFKCYDSAIKEHARLVTKLDSLNLPSEERLYVDQLKDKKMELEKEVWA
jgi:hypothetical protein